MQESIHGILWRKKKRGPAALRPLTISAVLLLAGVSVYVNNFVAALNFLPTASTYAFTHGDSHQVREALLTIASSNLIIAVSRARLCMNVTSSFT